MNHCVRNPTSRRTVFEKLRNSEITFLIIISLKSGMENSIIQELSAEADRIIDNKLLLAKSRQRYAHVYKLFIEWQNEKKSSSFSEEILIVYFNEKICFLIFTNHASFRDTICSWNILSSFRDSPEAPAPPLDPRAALQPYSLPRPSHHPHASNNCSHSSRQFPCPHRVK